MLKAGFASAHITPPLGKQIPGLFERRIAEGVHDHLYARAALVDDGTTCVALVQVDSIKVPEDVVRAARREARRLCGISGANCFIAATHTHSGGPIFSGFLSECDPDYPGFIAHQIASVIAEAHRLRRPALCGTERDQAVGVAFNRRFLMKDGTCKTHPGKMNPDITKPDGPANPEVTVTGFCDPRTLEPFGCIVNFACHCTHMNGYSYSADYVKWVTKTLQAVYGPAFGVVYLNGACGDVTQIDNRSPRPSEFGPYWCQRTGRVVAGGALQALARIDYNARATVGNSRTTVRANVRATTVEQRRAARALLAKKTVTAADIETIYARELLEVDAVRKKNPVRKLEVSAVRIADALYWGVPGELFQAFALEVAEASSFPHTCCVELANGYNGYICTPQAFSGGGYEVRTARSSLLEQDTGARIVLATKRLSKRMFAQAQKEIRSLPKRKVWPSSCDTALDGIEQLVT